MKANTSDSSKKIVSTPRSKKNKITPSEVIEVTVRRSPRLSDPISCITTSTRANLSFSKAFSPAMVKKKSIATKLNFASKSTENNDDDTKRKGTTATKLNTAAKSTVNNDGDTKRKATTATKEKRVHKKRKVEP